MSITVCIGEELLKAVTSWDLQEASTLFPFLRASFLACQLTSPKIVDETARLLVKSDLDRLKGANLRQNLLQAEQMVSHDMPTRCTWIRGRQPSFNEPWGS